MKDLAQEINSYLEPDVPLPTPHSVPGETLGLGSSSLSFLELLLGMRPCGVLGSWWEFSVGAAVASHFRFGRSANAGFVFVDLLMLASFSFFFSFFFFSAVLAPAVVSPCHGVTVACVTMVNVWHLSQ